jgi:myosin heavy subunit
MHEKNPLYAKSRIGDSKQFGVSHYSGLVAYDVSGFLDKNRDTLQVCVAWSFFSSFSSSLFSFSLG